MKLIINENQYRRLFEDVTNNEEKQHLGDRVMVYYNLHKHTFSVSYNGRVIAHADYVKLLDVEFKQYYSYCRRYYNFGVIPKS